MSVKKKVFSVIQPASDGDKISRAFDLCIIALIVINVVLVIADTFNLPSTVSAVSSAIEDISIIIFTIEYILRLWTSDLLLPEIRPIIARLRYAFSFLAIIDLLSILPFYIPFVFPVDLRVLRALRIIRLFRVFKFNRYTTALSSIWDVFKRKKHQLVSSISVVLLLMVISSVIMYSVESEAQPDAFGNAFSALWWAVATLTTVGYGDIYPITVIGKILSAIIALLGIGLVAVPTGIISSGFIEKIDDPESDHNHKSFCPYCGHKLDE